jgi:hypothetical protein
MDPATTTSGLLGGDRTRAVEDEAGLAGRTIDFLVIGAQKSGTTSLWRGLDSHPEIRTPSDKERSFFDVDERYEMGIEHFVRWTFEGATPEQLLGVVNPLLMKPDEVRLPTIVDRIGATCSDAKLVAVLRDPIERAASYVRWAKRQEGARPEDLESFAGRLASKHGGLTRVPFLRAGEYGWILSFYLERFRRDQILILFTEDLDRRPDEVYRRLFEFLGVGPEHDAASPRVNVGGTRRRVTTAAMDELLSELERVWPATIDPDARRGFTWWAKTIWNVEPDEVGTEVPDRLRRLLAEHYLRDEEILREQFGVSPPWTAAYDEIVRSH